MRWWNRIFVLYIQVKIAPGVEICTEFETELRFYREFKLHIDIKFKLIRSD